VLARLALQCSRDDSPGRRECLALAFGYRLARRLAGRLARRDVGQPVGDALVAVDAGFFLARQVGLPRPRALEITASPEFNALRLEVLALIREESQRAAAQI
jgi:hypothetical protein